MNKESLTRLDKAAVVLMCLGEDATAKIFQEFSTDEIRKITKAMAEIDHIPNSTRNEVLETFLEAQNDFAGIFLKGSEFAKIALAKTEMERTDELLDQFITGTESRPLEAIALMQPRMVAALLEKEHPQTIALVLSTQHVRHASETLSWLSETQRADIIYRIAKLEKVSPDVIAGIEEALNKEIGRSVGREQRQVGGIDKVVDLLENLQNNLDNEILEAIEESDSELVEEIRKRMFTFENLVNLDSRSLQMILREVNNDALTLALKTASEEMKEKIFKNISVRAAEMIEDDLEAMGPVRLSDVENMQQSIVKIAMKLEDEGKIIISKLGAEEFV